MLPVFRDLGPGLESILPIVLPICISYLVLHNNPKVAQFKSTNIYYLVVSVSQKSECHVAECLWLKVAHEGTVKLPARAVVSSGSPAGGEKCASRFIRVDVCKPQSLLLWDLPQGCPQHGSWSPPAEGSKREQERAPRMKVTDLYHPVSGVASPYSCRLLFVRSASLNLAHTREERITRGVNTRRRRSLGPACHTRPSFAPYK